MGAVTYFVRMVANEGKAEEVQQLLLENPRRIEQGELGNLAFGCTARSIIRTSFGCMRPGRLRKR